MLFSLIAGCAWIGATPHRLDQATWQLEFVQALVDCSDPDVPSTGLVLTASVPDPELDGIELTVTVEGPEGRIGSATSTVQGASITWQLGEADLADGDALTLVLNGELAERAESFPATVRGLTLYPDADGDGFGAGSVVTDRCVQGGGYVDNNADCDDSDATTNPSVVERCEPGDQNCDGSTSEGAIDAVQHFLDADGDGFGDPDNGQAATCDPPAGVVANHDDCDDGDPDVSPTAVEVCNGLDDDCDGATDDDDDNTQNPLVYPDHDGDGHGAIGVPALPAANCLPGLGEVIGDHSDCNDDDADIHPGATERCDEIDTDCDGESGAEPDAINNVEYYEDQDGDDVGVFPAVAFSCDGAPMAGLAQTAGDCNDNNPSMAPYQPEVCDGIDNDCDPGTHESGATYGDHHDDRLMGLMQWLVGQSPPADADVFICGEQRLDNAYPWPPNLDLNLIGTGDLDHPTVLDGSMRVEGPLDVSNVRWTSATRLPNTLGVESVARMALVIGPDADLRITASTVDCIDSDDDVTNGGAFYVDGGRLEITTDSTVQNCEATSNGGAIFATNDARLRAVFRTEFQGNGAVLDGGAIYADGAELYIDDAVFMSNSANIGGAVAVRNDDATLNLRIAESTFQSNVAHQHGGAISLVDVDGMNLGSGSFIDNHATTGAGGAVHALDTRFFPATLDQGVELTFQGNSSFGAGGALHLRATSQQTTACLVNLPPLPLPVRFDGNVAGTRGGGISILADGASGCDINVGDAVFANNSADRGYAIAASNDQPLNPVEVDLGTARFYGHTFATEQTDSATVHLENSILDCEDCTFGIDEDNADNFDELFSVTLESSSTSFDYNGLIGPVFCSDAASPGCTSTP